MLEFEQFYLFVDTTGVTGQAAVRADNTVAGNDNGNFVVTDGSADRLCGHLRQTLPLGKLTRDFAVGRGLSVGDFPKNVPHRLLKF